MSATAPQSANFNGAAPMPAEVVNIQEVLVEYDPTTHGVTVNPNTVDKGKTVRFRAPDGTKLRIAFLSPMAEELKSVSDSELCTLAVGGIYHFKCYFTLPGWAHEISPQTGGVIDVRPHLP